MYVFDLVAKLRRCNDRIYLKNDGVFFEGQGYAGIWLQKPRGGRAKGLALTRGAKRLREAASGQVDVMLSNTPWPETPQFERLNFDGKAVGMRGWRTIVLTCVEKKAFTLERAKKIFGSSLGDYDWDRLDYYGKQQALQKEAAGKSWRAS